MYIKNKDSSKTVRVSSQNSDFLATNPRAAAYASKMVRDRYERIKTPGEGVDVPDEGIFSTLINRRARKNLDAETIMKLSPDVKLIKSLLTSITMSPIDMDSGGVSFKVNEGELPGSITNPLLDIIRNHFTGYYNLNEHLPEMIGKALFDEGASIHIVVPEASVDDMINNTKRVSTEDFLGSFLDEDRRTFKPIGILGGVTTGAYASKGSKRSIYNTHKLVSIESAMTIQIPEMNTRVNDYVSITDNIEMLNLPILKEKVQKELVRNRVNAGVYASLRRNESTATTEAHNAGIKKIQDQLYRNPGQYKNRRIEIMSSAHSASRSSIGHPAVMGASSASCVPAFIPGEERNHLAYIVAIDPNTGHVIDIAEEMKDNISRGMGTLDNNQAMNLTSSLIQQTQIMTSGYCLDNDKMAAHERLKLFTQVYEENILARINNGIMGHRVKLGENEDFYRVMWARHMANQNIHLLFVPADQVAYFAYDYDKNGMGKSLLDDVKQVSALRIMTSFANFMTAVNNAVGRTKVTLNIDPRSPDPEKDYHILMDEYLRGQSNTTPTDVTSASEMFRVLRNMGITFEAQGNARLPNTSVQVDTYQSTKQMIDPEFTNELKTQQYMGLFVTPDMVDMTQQGDFAITRWTSNQLFAKRIKWIQDVTCRHAKKLVTAYTLSSGTLLSEMQKSIDGNSERIPENYKPENTRHEPIKHQAIIQEFMEKLVIELPSPSSTKYVTQLEEMTKYATLLDEGIRYRVSQELTGGVMDETHQEAIDLYVNAVKSKFMRDWMDKEDVLPELQDLARKGTEDNPALNLSKEYMLNLNNTFTTLGEWADAIKLRNQMRHELVSANNPALGEVSGGGSSTPPEESNSDDSPPSDGDFDMPGLEMPPLEEETPPEPAAEEPATTDAPEQPPAPTAPTEGAV